MSYGRPPPDVEGMTSLKVDNLTYRTSPDTLRRVFEKYGRVGDVYIPRDRYTKESRGFAFVRFHDKRDAEDAMDAMDGAVLDGRELRVQMARYGRPPDSHHSRRGPPPRRYGSSGYGRRSRRLVRDGRGGRRSSSCIAEGRGLDTWLCFWFLFHGIWVVGLGGRSRGVVAKARGVPPQREGFAL